MGAIQDDQQRLEDWLDGELSESACDELRGRLSRDPEMAAELTRLQSERQARSSFWQYCEPSADQIDALANRVRGDCLKHQVFQRRIHLLRNGVAVAATFAVVFASGWMGRGRMPQQNGVAPTQMAATQGGFGLPAVPVQSVDYSMPPVNLWHNYGSDRDPVDSRGLSTLRPTFKLVLVDQYGTAIDYQDIEDIHDPRKVAKPFADLQGRLENAQRPGTTLVNQIVPR